MSRRHTAVAPAAATVTSDANVLLGRESAAKGLNFHADPLVTDGPASLPCSKITARTGLGGKCPPRSVFQAAPACRKVSVPDFQRRCREGPHAFCTDTHTLPRGALVHTTATHCRYLHGLHQRKRSGQMCREGNLRVKLTDIMHHTRLSFFGESPSCGEKAKSCLT